MNELPETMRRSDKWIPWYFVLFFAVIAIVDFTFVTIAVQTHTGTVTDRAYEKGLAFDRILERAKAQESLGVSDDVRFENGTIVWTLTGKDNAPLTGAKVMVRLYRPAKDGQDFQAPLAEKGKGQYEAVPPFPARGLWTAMLEAQWDDMQKAQKTYTRSFDLIVP